MRNQINQCSTTKMKRIKKKRLKLHQKPPNHPIIEFIFSWSWPTISFNVSTIGHSYINTRTWAYIHSQIRHVFFVRTHTHATSDVRWGSRSSLPWKRSYVLELCVTLSFIFDLAVCMYAIVRARANDDYKWWQQRVFNDPPAAFNELCHIYVNISHRTSVAHGTHTHKRASR